MLDKEADGSRVLRRVLVRLCAGATVLPLDDLEYANHTGHLDDGGHDHGGLVCRRC